MENDLTRLKLLCRGLYYVLIAIAALMVLASAVLVVTVVVAYISPESMVVEGIDAGQAVMILAILAIMVVLALFVIVMLMNIARSIYREYSPFTPKNVRRLEVISLLYLVLPVVFLPLEYGVLGEVGVGDVLLAVFTGVISAAIFYCLALVFRYGAWLQNESDETL